MSTRQLKDAVGLTLLLVFLPVLATLMAVFIVKDLIESCLTTKKGTNAP